ncbi:unnamed protein product [Laminaria digitata]
MAASNSDDDDGDGDAADFDDADDANSEDGDDDSSWQAEGSEEGNADESAVAEVGVEAFSSVRRQRLRNTLAGGVLGAGRVAMGVADDGNNQDRKLCEVIRRNGQ